MTQDIQLNKGQRQAVEWDKGPLLVLAGPGSGKTLALTKRVARLVEGSPGERFGVLGLTFTTQAADQMRHRVAKALGRESSRTRLMTFHAFSMKVLRQHGSHLGFRPDFRLLPDADRVGVLSRLLQEQGFESVSATDDDVRRVLRTIDYLYREAHDWEDAEAAVPLRGAAKEWAVPIYSAYSKWLLRNNYVDYGGLLMYCVRLFRRFPQISDLYRNMFRFACVDEYQDTNRAQDLILRAVYPDRLSNLFVVADPDQTIFQWNGADPQRICKLKRDYQMTVVQLPETFRCPQRVVDVANRLIARGSQRMVVREPMTVSGAHEGTGVIDLQQFESHDDEAHWVAQHIANRSCGLGECVVLARNNRLAETAARAFADLGLEPYLGARKDDFSSPLVGFVHSALKLADAPNDSMQLARLCGAFASLTGERLRKADAEAESGIEGRSPLRGFVEAAAAGIGESGRRLLQPVRKYLLDALDHKSFVDAVFQWQPCAESCFDRSANMDEVADEKRMWKRIEQQARRRLGTDITLAQLLQEFETSSKRSPPDPRQIQCLTIHGAKGKQFEHVYLIGLAEGELPSYHAIRLEADSDAGRRAVDEERRSCFVAITRARSTVTLTYAASYYGRRREPSRFLKEMGVVDI